MAEGELLLKVHISWQNCHTVVVFSLFLQCTLQVVQRNGNFISNVFTLLGLNYTLVLVELPDGLVSR